MTKKDMDSLNKRALAFWDVEGVLLDIAETVSTTKYQHGTMDSAAYAVRMQRIASMVADLRNHVEKLKTL